MLTSAISLAARELTSDHDEMIPVNLPTNFGNFQVVAGLTALPGLLLWLQGMTFGGGLQRLLPLPHLLVPPLVLGAIGGSVMTVVLLPAMKGTRRSKQIIGILKQAEAGLTTAQ